jgi:hypothetical protein
MKSMVFWVVVQSQLDVLVEHITSILTSLRLPPASDVSCLAGLLFNHEQCGDIFLRNAWISPNYRCYNPEDCALKSELRRYMITILTKTSKQKGANDVRQNHYH